MVLLTVALVFGMCLCIFNGLFQQDRLKRFTDEERKKTHPMNRPLAWLLYSIVMFTALLVIIANYVYRLLAAIQRLDGG